MTFFIIAGVVLSCAHQSSLGSLLVIAPTKLHPLWHTTILPLQSPSWLAEVIIGVVAPGLIFMTHRLRRRPTTAAAPAVTTTRRRRAPFRPAASAMTPTRRRCEMCHIDRDFQADPSCFSCHEDELDTDIMPGEEVSR